MAEKNRKLSIGKEVSEVKPDYTIKIKSSDAAIWGIRISTGGQIFTEVLELPELNLFEFPSEFSNSYWTKTALTVTPNSGEAPDGSNNLTFLKENTTNSTHILRRSVLLEVGTYEFSIYAKKGGSRNIGLNFNGKNTAALFDINTGSVVHTAGTPFPTVTQENGFFQFKIKGTMTSEAAVDLRIYLGNEDIWLSPYQGDGVSGVDIWNAKITKIS